ncbi:hypothetical protein [Rhodobacter sp. NSM]|uniref:hypothetical protein n=1 Tax=Rhodobacter sp. NSM TaxID=3457501 RepID=UPI003FD460D2
MTPEDYDEELRWRLEVLRAKFEEGKIHVAKHLAADLEKSLSAVRYGADGKIDLSTVDGRVRAMAMMAAAAKQREEVKGATSLEDITNTYFKYIEENLDFFVKEAGEKGYDAHIFAKAVARQPSAVADIHPQIPRFLEGLQEFWSAIADCSHYHVQDLAGTKAVYGGDLFPSYQRNIASSTGLYLDTIILSDPFWHTRQIFERAAPEIQAYYLVKHAINLMQYKDLALAKLENPIVVVTPFKSSVDAEEVEFLKRVAERDGLIHAGKIFGRKFESTEELFGFTAKLDTPDRAVREIVDRERLLFDTGWTGTLEDQIRRSSTHVQSMFSAGNGAGDVIASQCIGRMMQATDILLKSRYLQGTPLIDAPTSWKYFNWKLEYNSALADDDVTHLHMVRGLQRVADTDMQWLGTIPPNALIEMRQQGAFHEIREMLSAGVREIAAAKPEAFFRSSDQIVDNVQAAFHKHQENIADLRKKGMRFAGQDLGSWIVSGAVELAAIATGTPAFGAAAFAINQVVDAPKLKEIPERFRELRDAHHELKRSPMGLFFAHK